jgi:dihydroorotate dehydrogenase electron transfer subunit
MSAIKTQKKFFPARVIENYPLRRVGAAGNYLIQIELEENVVCHSGQFFKFSVYDANTDRPSHISFEINENDLTLVKKGTASEELTKREALISRPYSIGLTEYVGAHTLLTFLYKVVGPGSEKLSTVKTGEYLLVQGPLGGSSFYLPKKVREVIMVAGGVGLPPLLFLTQELLHKKNDRVVILVGAATSDTLPLRGKILEDITSGDVKHLPSIYQLLGDPRVKFMISTDDGSEGRAGFVTGLLEEEIRDFPSQTLAVYTCGPKKMMEKVAGIAESAGLPCQVCMEEMMGCGIGACQSCVVKVKSDNEKGWCYKLACRDGPVFDAKDIFWE